MNLAKQLEEMRYYCKLEKINDEKYIIIQKIPEKKKRKILSSPWIPRILFAVVIGFVMLIDLYYYKKKIFLLKKISWHAILFIRVLKVLWYGTKLIEFYQTRISLW